MLPDSYRLKKRRDFNRAYNRGRLKACPEFVLYYYRSNNQQARLGLSASKKLGSAVVRNRVKRIFRHAAAATIDNFEQGYDYIFVIRQASTKRSFWEIEALMCKVLKQINPN